MTDLTWNPLGTFKVPAQPLGLWTLVADYISDGTLIKIEADKEARWNYSKRTADGCGPNGDLTSHIPAANCLVATAPPGCLVGKIGGSTADNGVAQFVIGSFAVYIVADDTAGPLYLTMNDEPTGFSDNSGEIEVTISTALKP